MALDRNPNSMKRMQRNWQRLRDGAGTAVIGVTPPITNSGSAIGLALDANGGLQTNSGALQIKLPASSGLAISASGLSVFLNATTPCLSLTSGLNVTINGTTLEKTSTGLRVRAGGIGSAELGILTTKGDLLGRSTVHARIPVGANGTVLTANSALTLGVGWAAPAVAGLTSQTPTGTVNGTNPTFTLSATPVILMLFTNGILQNAGAGNDYTISGATITYLTGAIPQTGDVLRAVFST